MKKFVFGAAYYEEYQPEDRLEKDMALIRDAGMNTIRIAESTWSVEEPRCGEFDFSHVMRVIEAAERFGIDVIIGTPTYAVPKWLADLDPEILGRNKFGPRQNMDITNPTYRFYAERIIRELVSRTASCANVIGFQIDNETKHYGMNNTRVLDGFRAWLKKRFGSIEAVNAAFGLRHWSSSVASFEELPDPEGTVNGGYACAFEEYRRELAAEFLLWQAGIVSEYKREDQFVTHNLDYEWKFFGAEGQQEGYSCGVQPGISHFEAAKALTLIGTDVYCPPCGELTGREIAFGGSLMRPLKREPYLVLESQTQAFTGWLPWPGQLKLMTLAHLAAGACGQMYWPWASIHGGLETYWKGILSHDGEPGETYAEVREIGRMLRTLAPELEEKARAPIAVIVSPENLHAMKWFPTDRRLSYNDVVNSFHQALYELNLDCDILYDRETDWSGYRLLVFPEFYCASEEMIARVRDYVAQGGSVFAGFRSFYADENARPRHERQPYGLTDVFGLHYDRFTKNDRHLWMELLEAEGAEVLKRYDDPHWGGYAALTRNRFGQGTAWYLGCTLKNGELKTALAQAAAAAGIAVPAQQWPIVSMQRGKLHFVLNFSDAEQTLLCPVSGQDRLTGETHREGEPLTLSPWGAAVLG
ncbi:MAG: beta-galactosidase [Oscillospiraceae bacterium]|nr:beta-galactosidase [Oscillospiraceae bacterium]